jgi:hypothetical protein
MGIVQCHWDIGYLTLKAGLQFLQGNTLSVHPQEGDDL